MNTRPLLLLLVAAAAVAAIAAPVLNLPPALSTSAQAQAVPARSLFNPLPTTGANGSGRSGRDVEVALEVGYADFTMYNPWTGRDDEVHLRSYNGSPAGPTINVEPGTRLSVAVDNRLPSTEANFKCESHDGMSSQNGGHCFNTTNLHVHGMHVSPEGNSDNVFVRIEPGGRFDYQYDIPRNHPAGTFWYHAHLHGATAIQVASGTAGVLIVRGDRRVQDKARNEGNADIDTILKQPRSGQPLSEQTLLFQQIEYGCFEGPPAMTTPPQAPMVSPSNGFWDCPSGYVGELRNYQKQLVVGTWDASGRFTSINGVVQPVMPGRGAPIAAGELQRWRMVHGGIRDRINVRFVKADLAALLPPGHAGSTDAANVRAGLVVARRQLGSVHDRPGQAIALSRICNGETVSQLEMAADGITRTSFSEKQVNTLHSGQRSDVLVAFPTAGLYCVVDDAAAVNALNDLSSTQQGLRFKDRRLLSFVEVGSGPGVPDVAPDGLGRSKYWQHVRNQLVAANPDLPTAVRQDLASLRIPEYAPVQEIACPESGCAPTRSDEYTVVVNRQDLSASKMGINGLSFVGDPGTPAYDAYSARNYFRPVLGTTQEWRITGMFEHIFHVHVNAFQVVDVLDNKGVSIYRKNPDGSLYRSPALGVSECTAQALLAFRDPVTGDVDRQYCDQGGVIRDTVVQLGGPPRSGLPGYTVVMRTRFEDYSGRFVMHCHILDHEDNGMMMDVEIVDPAADRPHALAPHGDARHGGH